MCEPISLSTGLALAGTAVSAATAGAGMYMSNQAQERQAKAVADQNRAQAAAQNTAFYERAAATRRQSDAQSAVMQQGIADQAAATDRMRARENTAIDQRQQLLAATNTQADALRARGDAAGAALLEQTNKEALDKAQADRQAQQALLLDQSGAVPVPGAGPAGPTAGDPGAGSTSTSTGSDTTDAAVSRRMAQAATNIRTYGQELAKTASYAQPLNTVALATTNTGTGIMPAQAADKLLSTGTPIRLLPAQLAYRNAADAGQSQIAALQSNAQGQLGLAGLDYSNTMGGANLAQADATTTAANIAAQAKQDALWGQQMGGILSGIGNLGMYASGYYGGGPSWLKPNVPGAPAKVT
jgi:hypothetical protein